MDLDKLIKEAYLLKNKEDNINKLYEMVETMLALQESGLLKEEEEQEDISVDLGYLDTILNQPPPAKDPAKQAAREFYNLWKDRDDDYSLINDFKHETDYYEEIRSMSHNQGRVKEQDSAIQIITNFLDTADNIDPKILDYMNNFNDTVKQKIGYDAAVQKFKDSDGGGIPDSLERDNETNPEEAGDDLGPYQTQDATEPEEYANLEVYFKGAGGKLFRFNLEYDPERPFSVFTADSKMKENGSYLNKEPALRLDLFIDSFDFGDNDKLGDKDKEEIKEFYLDVFTTKRGNNLKLLEPSRKLVDQNDLNSFETLGYEEQKDLIFDIFKITRRVIEYKSTNSVVQKMKQYWIKSATTALNNFKQKLSNKQKNLDFKNFVNRKLQVLQAKGVEDFNEPAKLLFSYNNFATNLEIDFDPNIVEPENYSSRGIDSPSIQSARLPTELKDFNKIIEKVFGPESGSTENIIKKRIKQFTEFSEQYTRTGNIDKDKPITKFISELLLLNLFNEMNKSFQREEGRYLFEYFLALLIGGKPVGSERGAVDFELGEQRGSAKYLKTGEGATQAIKGFKPNKPVTYVVAQRASPTEESPRAEELLFVDISVFDVVMSEKNGKKTFKYKSIDGADEDDLKITFTKKGDYKDVQLDEALRGKTYIGTITLATMSEGEYKGLRDIVGEKLDAQENEASELKKLVLDAVTKIFDNLKEAETNARMYVSSGESGDGINAITKLDDSKKELKSLSGLKTKSGKKRAEEYKTLDGTQQNKENT